MTDKTKTIADLNDLARKAMGVACRLAQTSGINALPPETQSAIRERVEMFDDFHPGNDPHHEHDFGSFVENHHTVFWKIDYYDPTLEFHSAAEAARAVCFSRRVRPPFAPIVRS